IGESRDAEMGRIEAQIRDQFKLIDAELENISDFVDERERVYVERAIQVFAETKDLAQQILTLSTTNSDFRATDISVNKARASANACIASLDALREKLHHRLEHDK